MMLLRTCGAFALRVIWRFVTVGVALVEHTSTAQKAQLTFEWRQNGFVTPDAVWMMRICRVRLAGFVCLRSYSNNLRIFWSPA